MASNIRVGQKVRVTIRFVDFDQVNDTDDLLEPNSVSGFLYKLDTTTSTYIIQGSLSPIVNSSLGIYYHDWITPDNGKFKLVFRGEFYGATPSYIENPREFYVGTAEPTVTLGTKYDAFFLSVLDPLYLDPDIILTYFPEVDLVEATEIIYRLSLQMDEWFGANFVLTNLHEEYLIAATLCELSKTYLIDGGMNGFGKSDSFSLGDLTINNGFGGGANSKGGVYRGNAGSWCELAHVLKNELMRSKVTFMPVVKGSNFDNPIPSRSLRKFD